ncbi:MAG: FAD-dependent oxidoreductase [Bacteroidia bacterium]|nr:FAD-dependent oxidoreductase [Bacteroidia bacterium]
MSSGLFIPAWLSACADEPPGPAIKYDGTVVVIGAGAAGLLAADILAAQGVNVVVLEASERMGGRVKSLRQFQDAVVKPDFPVDFGADRIFGSASELAIFASESHVQTVDFRAAAADAYILDGVADTNGAADPDVIAARTFLDALPGYTGADVSVTQAIEAAGLNARVHAILNGWIGNRYGTNNDRLGMKALAEMLSLAQSDNVQLTLASNPMEDVLISRFANVAGKVSLNTPVASIDYSGDAVIITDKNGGTIRADKVIVTVPLSILKNNEIQFTPTLPSSKTTAFSKFGMDASVRVILDFKKDLWGDSTAYVFGGTQGPEYFNAGIKRAAVTNTLSITINGSRAEELSALGDDMIPQILSELDTAYNNEASPNVRRYDSDGDTIEDAMRYLIQDWTKEPYIQGYGSYPKTGATNADREAMAATINNVVYFAGEATDATGYAGTLSGALLSGKRVAEEVIASILTS